MRAGISARFFLPALVGLPFAAALARGGVVPGAIMAIELAVLALLTATTLLALQGVGPRPGLGSYDLPFAALFALALTSWFWSTYPGSTRLELMLWLSLAFFYLLCSAHLTDRRAIRRFAWWLAAGGAFFSLFALVLTSGHLLGLATFARKTGYWASFTFVNHNHFAGFVAPLALLAIGLAMAVPSPARIVALVLAFASSLAVLVSLSRGGMLSLLVSCLFLLLCFRATGSRKRSSILLSALFLLILALGFLDLGPVRERLETLSDLQSASAHRSEIWATSLQMIGDAPWLGSGLGTYRHRWPLHQDGAMKSALHAHSDYLELSSELGMVGLLIFLGGTFLVFRKTLPALLRTRDRGMQGIGLGALAVLVYCLSHGWIDFNTHIPSNALLYMACVALALRSASMTEAGELRRWWLPGDMSMRNTRFASIAAWALALVLATLAVLPWLAWRSAQKGERLFWDLQYEAATDSYSKSLGMLPDQMEAAAALGDARLAASRESLDLGSSLDAYDRSLSACPTCLDVVIAKAHALESTGATVAAEAQFRQAYEIARLHPAPALQLGLFLLRHDRWHEAQTKLRQALFLARGSQETYHLVFREIERIEGLSSILDALPLGAESLILHAQYLVERQAYAYAAQQWQEIIAHDDSPENVLSHLDALARGEDRSAARARASQYADAYPDHPRILLLAASLLTDGGDSSQTLSILESVLDQDPSNVRARVGLARLFCQGETSRKGLAILEEGLRESPFEIRYLMAEAICCMSTERFERSLASAKKAVELAPEDPRTLFTLGQIYLGLRLDQQAADSWSRCLEVSPENFACKARLEHLLARLER